MGTVVHTPGPAHSALAISSMRDDAGIGTRLAASIVDRKGAKCVGTCGNGHIHLPARICGDMRLCVYNLDWLYLRRRDSCHIGWSSLVCWCWFQIAQGMSRWWWRPAGHNKQSTENAPQESPQSTFGIPLPAFNPCSHRISNCLSKRVRTC